MRKKLNFNDILFVILFTSLIIVGECCSAQTRKLYGSISGQVVGGVNTSSTVCDTSTIYIHKFVLDDTIKLTSLYSYVHHNNNSVAVVRFAVYRDTSFNALIPGAPKAVTWPGKLIHSTSDKTISSAPGSQLLVDYFMSDKYLYPGHYWFAFWNKNEGRPRMRAVSGDKMFGLNGDGIVGFTMPYGENFLEIELPQDLSYWYESNFSVAYSSIFVALTFKYE